MAYAHDETLFTIAINDDGPFEYSLPGGSWNVEFEEVQTSGDAELEFIGFVEPGWYKKLIKLKTLKKVFDFQT